MKILICLFALMTTFASYADGCNPFAGGGCRFPTTGFPAVRVQGVDHLRPRWERFTLKVEILCSDKLTKQYKLEPDDDEKGTKSCRIAADKIVRFKDSDNVDVLQMVWGKDAADAPNYESYCKPFGHHLRMDSLAEICAGN